jgi:hypothetical protein
MNKKKQKLNKVEHDEVLTLDKSGRPFLGGKELKMEEFERLKKEAKMIKETSLWKILTETLRHQAYLTMFEKSKNWEDMLTGKSMLYNIGVQEKIVELLTIDLNAKPVVKYKKR